MAETGKATDIVGKPYFLKETENGVFEVVNKIIFLENGGWSYEYNPGLGKLVLDQHIREIPTHGLSLLVKFNQGSCQGEYIASELRKFAKLAWYDFVTAELFGEGYLGESVTSKGNLHYIEVRPRVFRNINQ